MALLLSVALPGMAAVQIGELWYNLDDAAKTATLARHADYTTMETVTVPGSVRYNGNDYAVTAIAQQAFQQCSNLVSINISEGVATIGDWAFWKSVNLESVILPSSMTTIGDYAFAYTSLYSVNVPDGVQSIGEYCFRGCSSLMSISLPANLKVIESNLFNGCTNLTTVILPSNLEEIKRQAFNLCGISAMSIPSSVKTIGKEAFSGCALLKSVTLPENITEIADQMFYNCSSLSTVNLSSKLKSIGYAAFYGCASLGNISLTLPETVDYIGEMGFYGCAGMTEFVLPKSITSVSSNMLYGCTGLTKVSFHDGVTEFGTAVFQGCTSLRSVTLPPKVTAISTRLFSTCTALESVDMPSGVTEIGESAFHNCTSLRSIDISENVTKIGNGAFLGCSQITAFNVAAGNTVYATVDGALYDKDITVLLMYPNGRQGAYRIPESVTRIDAFALNSCRGLTSINIPAKLKTIGMSAFVYCSKLAEIDFAPEGLETIEDNAFYGCIALSGTVKLPQTLKSIGRWAFNNCDHLAAIVLPNADVAIGEEAFSNTSVTNMIFPEGITSIGVPSTDTNYSIMDGCSALTCVVFPSTLEQLRPFAVASGKFSTIYSHALVPPVLAGSTANSMVSSVMVPKGKSSVYEQAWGDLYPMADFNDVLPGEPEVATSSIAWDVYSAAGYPATPVRYQLSITTGSGAPVKEVALDASGVVDGTSTEAPASGHIAYAVKGVSAGNYKYDLKGYAAQGQLVYAYSGAIDVESSGIDEVIGESAVNVVGNTISAPAGVEIRVYGFDGSLVAVTSRSVTLPAGMYVVVADGKAVKVAIR